MKPKVVNTIRNITLNFNFMSMRIRGIDFVLFEGKSKYKKWFRNIKW